MSLMPSRRSRRESDDQRRHIRPAPRRFEQAVPVNEKFRRARGPWKMHPEALAELHVCVSPHPAPIIQPERVHFQKPPYLVRCLIAHCVKKIGAMNLKKFSRRQRRGEGVAVAVQSGTSPKLIRFRVITGMLHFLQKITFVELQLTLLSWVSQHRTDGEERTLYYPSDGRKLIDLSAWKINSISIQGSLASSAVCVFLNFQVMKSP